MDCYDFSNYPSEIKETLCELFKTKTYLYLFIISLLISVQTTDILIKDTIHTGNNPDYPPIKTDIFPLKITSNILSTTGIVFFFCLASKELRNNPDKTDCSPFYNYTASGLALFVAVLRLWDIIYTGYRPLTESLEEEVTEDILQISP